MEDGFHPITAVHDVISRARIFHPQLASRARRLSGRGKKSLTTSPLHASLTSKKGAKEFAKEFVYTNYFYQRECFKEIIKEYEKEIEGDKKIGRVQLYSGLEELYATFKGPIMKAMNKVCKACEKYLVNPFSCSQED